MQATQTVTPNFDTVWAALQEVAASQKETDRIVKETARQMQETDRKMEETARQIEETSRQMKKSDEKMDKYSEKVKELSKSFGRVVEYMVTPNLREKLRKFKLDFPRANSNTCVDDNVNNIHFEIDVMLENGDKAMLVEVKATLTTGDIKEHIERIEKMRKYADLHGDKRKFLGAVAGVVIRTNVKQYALKQGLYVIEPSGETFNIIPPTNKPKEW